MNITNLIRFGALAQKRWNMPDRYNIQLRVFDSNRPRMVAVWDNDFKRVIEKRLEEFYSAENKESLFMIYIPETTTLVVGWPNEL